MCLITWVYYSTFVHARHGTPTKLLASAMILSKGQFLNFAHSCQQTNSVHMPTCEQYQRGIITAPIAHGGFLTFTATDGTTLYRGCYKPLPNPRRVRQNSQMSRAERAKVGSWRGRGPPKGTKDARNTPHNVRRGLCHSTATVLSGAALQIPGLSKAGASFVRLPSTYRENRGGVGALGPRGGPMDLLATNVPWYVEEHNGRATMPYLQAQPAAIRHPPPHRALLSSSEK